MAEVTTQMADSTSGTGTGTGRNGSAPLVLIANPSSDVYGSDLQMLESIDALLASGHRVLVTTPDEGPLVDQITERGATVRRLRYPVVRRENASPLGIVRLAVAAARSLPQVLGLIRQTRPSLIYVNTVTLPWWLLAARLVRVPSLCHLHEAEEDDKLAVRRALNYPLFLANRLIVNSSVSMDTMCAVAPRLRSRTALIYNGVPGPADEPSPSTRSDGPRRLALVSRLSPRKGTDVAIQAIVELRSRGRDVHLELCGTAFAGYEWFVEELEAAANSPELKGSVTFAGYVRPVWSALERAEIALAPSLRDSFGNVVVEAQLAARPVVAAAAGGHLEIVEDGRTGLLVTPGDPVALADAIERLLDDDALARSLADEARRTALLRFSIERYRTEVADLVARTSLSSVRR